MRRRALLALGLGLPASIAVPAAADEQTYVNARYGTRVTFPDTVFDRPQPPSENGDGMSWEAADGAWLGVWGSFNALDLDEKGLLGFFADGFDEVTYSRAGRRFVVVSGFDGGRVFYQRTVFGADGVLHTVLLRYATADKPKYDALVGRIAASLAGP